MCWWYWWGLLVIDGRGFDVRLLMYFVLLLFGFFCILLVWLVLCELVRLCLMMLMVMVELGCERSR